MTSLAMRLTSVALLLLPLAACTVDDLPTAPDGTGGQGGASGGSAGLGASSGASGQSGTSGHGGAGGAGTGGAGQGGGGAGQSQGGEAGAGTGGAGGAGMGGAGAGGADASGAAGAGMGGGGGMSGSSGQTGGFAGDGSSGSSGQGAAGQAGSGGVAGQSGASGQGGLAGAGQSGNSGAGQSGDSGAAGSPTAGQSGASGQSGAGQAGSAGDLSCVTLDDCPGPQTECAKRACVSNVCTILYTPTGQPVSSQTPGDCHRNECDGKGGTRTSVDDTDPPASPNACVVSTCQGGQVTLSNAPASTLCGQGMCDGNGNCFSCKTAGDCGQSAPCYGWQCVAGACQKTYVTAGGPATPDTPGDCRLDRCDGSGGITTTVNNLDPPDDGNECTTNACSNGAPTVTPRPGATCGAGTSQCGTCRPFQGSIACGACPAESYCGASGCLARKNGGACASSIECLSGSCLNGTCEACGKYPGAPGCLCVNNKKDAGETAADCGGDSCGPCVKGKTCLTAYDCASGLCNAGICL